MRGVLVGAVAAAFLAGWQQRGEPPPAPAWPADASLGRLTFSSSGRELQAAFDWARRQALAYAFRGDPVGDWYEAALPGREAFCMRDVAHQALGAQALGLARYTRNMLRRFAENIAESRDWCSYWEINRYNRPAPVDYASDTRFWYCLPANYDIVDCSYRMYTWTGDRSYIDDPVFLSLYRRTATDYEERWDLGLDQVMQRRRRLNVHGTFDPADDFLFFRGNPGYDERREPFVLGIDLLATQYASYLAIANIHQVRGDSQARRRYLQRAAAVKSLVNNTWWDDKPGHFYARLNADHRLEGHEDSALLYRGIVEDGPKLKAAVGALLERIRSEPSSQIELQSHYPEILYRYGAPDVASAQILDLSREGRARREYPEVSYSVVGAIVTGLMGIEPDADSVRTLPGLGVIAWAELRNLPVRNNEIAVRQEGGWRTILTNQKGPAVTWRAGFAGSFGTLVVNGKRVRAEIERSPAGQESSWVRVGVGPGNTASVEVPH
jgi:hypothetical protein